MKQIDHTQSSTHSPLAQLIFDPVKDEILFANQRACALFKYKEDQLLKSKLSSLFPGHFNDLLTLTQAVLELGYYWCANLAIQPDGAELKRNVEINAGVIKNAEKKIIQLFLQDAKELDQHRAVAHAHQHYLSGLNHWKRTERFFADVERDNQLILNAAGEGIYGVDNKGMTTFVNPVAEKLLGWTSDELVGKEIHNVIHHSHAEGEAYEKSHCPIYAAFHDGTIHRVVDEVFWRKDGKAIPVEYTSTPITDNGYLIGAVVVFRDVTEQKKAQQDLVNALHEVASLTEKLEQENAYLQEEVRADYNHKEIVGNSSAIQNIIQKIGLVGPTDATVLITGESGTGKELIARAIHDASDRSKRPLIRVNCAVIPRDLFESEFFGHIRGSFTGAVKDRVGRFALADKGTIFLDEVGELPYDLQSKLLRVLQEQQFERVGDTQTTSVDVRVIAATNKNLIEQVQKKKFREDLFFRFNVFPIESPALRNRQGDIPLLAMHFLQKAKEKFSKPDASISIAQMNQLRAYDWPGNIRELQNVIERQVIIAQNQHVTFDSLPQTLDIETPQSTLQVMTESERKLNEKQSIEQALRISKGKVSGQGGAAKLMGIKATTLASRIKKHQINTRFFKKN